MTCQREQITNYFRTIFKAYVYLKLNIKSHIIQLNCIGGSVICKLNSYIIYLGLVAIGTWHAQIGWKPNENTTRFNTVLSPVSYVFNFLSADILVTWCTVYVQYSIVHTISYSSWLVIEFHRDCTYNYYLSSWYLQGQWIGNWLRHKELF